MNPLYEAALRIQAFCEAERWRSCIIGGIAVHRWGRPRATKDVDLTLLTGFGGEDVFLDRLLTRYRLRDGFSREFVLTNRVLLLVDRFGVAVDLSLGAIPFEERSIARSSLWRSPEGHDLRTCSAEDLLVHKSFAARPHDWLDVEDVLDRQQERLDLDLVRRELKPLAELKPETDIMPELERRICRSQRPVRRFE